MLSISTKFSWGLDEDKNIEKNLKQSKGPTKINKYQLTTDLTLFRRGHG